MIRPPSWATADAGAPYTSYPEGWFSFKAAGYL